MQEQREARYTPVYLSSLITPVFGAANRYFDPVEPVPPADFLAVGFPVVLSALLSPDLSLSLLSFLSPV